jgi:hypothetical protein
VTKKQLLEIWEIAKAIRRELPGKPSYQCVRWTQILVDELQARGYDAKHMYGMVLYDDWFNGDPDAWGDHHWAMIGGTLIDISGDQFNRGGFIEKRSRKIPPVNIVRWRDVEGKTYQWTDDGPVEIRS